MDFSTTIDPSDLFSAKGLVIVITGAGTGIGLAFAHACARSGASKIYLLGRRLPKLQEACTLISSASSSSSSSSPIAIALQCDVTSPTSIASAVTHIESEVGYIDVLINNAGVIGPHQDHIHSASSIQELQQIMLQDWEQWDDAWRTNTSAIVATTGAFLHLLDKGNTRRGWPHGKREQNRRSQNVGDEFKSDRRMSQIITVASIGAFNRECTAGLAYTGSKAGAVAIAKSLAYLLSDWGIRSNIICPGRFMSEMTAGSATEFPVNEVPFGSMGDYEDLASAILYLVGKSGSYLNGNVLTPDGGRLQVMPATN